MERKRGWREWLNDLETNNSLINKNEKEKNIQKMNVIISELSAKTNIYGCQF